MNATIKLKLSNYFLKHVVKSTEEEACWKFTGKKTKEGYGRLVAYEQVTNHQTIIPAHRYSYELHIKPIPEGLLVLHKCDNPECCNPKHLFLGTHVDNAQDMLNKGRAPRKGMLARNRKLTEEQVIYFWTNRKLGASFLSSKTGVNISTIQNIISQTRWTSITSKL